jgi:SAM-dependent methyltransferase
VQAQGLQDRVEFVIGDAADASLIKSLGKFDLIFSTYTLHHWTQPRQVIDNLLAALADTGILFLHDLRRVWWLYWIPSQSGFFKSVRGAYVRQEIEELLTGLNPAGYEIKNEIPFLQSVIIKKAALLP